MTLTAIDVDVWSPVSLKLGHGTHKLKFIVDGCDTVSEYLPTVREFNDEILNILEVEPEQEEEEEEEGGKGDSSHCWCRCNRLSQAQTLLWRCGM